MNGSCVVGFVVVLVGLALGAVFVSFPRGSYVTTEIGPSCEVCLDSAESTTAEKRVGFPLVWKTRIEKNGSFQEDEFRRIDNAMVDFIAGVGIVLILAGVIIRMRKKI
ncbi:MAG: hypothetical protein KatS3mg087_1873 [Patescibacteria group bacterium]|nr:MAG: hypothetical protein KatS3mg087_1873 [Patescibacteria group bacterium]